MGIDRDVRLKITSLRILKELILLAGDMRAVSATGDLFVDTRHRKSDFLRNADPWTHKSQFSYPNVVPLNNVIIIDSHVNDMKRGQTFNGIIILVLN